MIWEDIKGELKKLAVVVVLGCLLGYAAYRLTSAHWNHQVTGDVAKAKTAEQAHVAQEKTSARVDTVLHELKKRESAHVARADSIHSVADTAKQAAVTVRDSLEMWHTRDSLHVAETVQLRAAKDTADARADSAEADRERWKSIAEGSNRINAQLRKDLEGAEPKCRILPFLPCPSRTVALAAGIVTGLAISHPEQTKRILTLGR